MRCGGLHSASHSQRGYFIKSLIPSLVLNILFLSLLLGCAGRWDYWPAWVYTGTSLVMSLLTKLVLRSNPELLEERNKPKTDAKSWDKKLLALGFVFTLCILVVAGLDAGRLHLNPVLTWPFFVFGWILNLVGMLIFLRSLRENRFFSAVVRIQTDRGHCVCKSGPYSIVRHPGYAGMIIGTIGIPLVLMSAWSAVPSLLLVVLMVRRTHLEDTTLDKELPGYREYRQTTRYRLVPGGW